MTITQLSLYNGALGIIGERSLASLTENREPRRILDQIWQEGNGGAVQACLEEGFWTHSIRTDEYTYSPSVEPSFGYQFAFNQPDDFVRTAAVCTDPYFDFPLTQYADEAGFWFSDLQTIYIKYVSNDPSYGLNYALWPQSFNYYVESYLAWRAVQRLTQDQKKRDAVEKIMNKALVNARSKAAMEQPAKFPPQGMWASARFGRQEFRRRGCP